MYGAIGNEDRSSLARNAYRNWIYLDDSISLEKRDKGLSRLVHEQKKMEGHRTNGDYIKSIVYGGLDGILSMFAIICGAAGGDLSVTAVLILGFSNLVADAFSMGVGDTISTLAYREHVEHERDRECWEFDNYPEGEIDEMVDLYEAKGLPRHKAQTVVQIMSKYREFFIDVMVAEELKLRIPHENENAYKEGLIMFGSFVFFGLMPLICYVLFPLLLPHLSKHGLFTAAAVVTILTLFLLGTLKSWFSSKRWWYSGFEFALLGSVCAMLSYGIGFFVAEIGKGAFVDLNH